MKRFLFFTLFVLTTSVTIFGFDYWYLDITVQNYYTRTSSIQRAYFFRDLRTLEEATGFPIKENETGNNRFRWRWDPANNYRPDSYFATVFSVMRRDGFTAAYVLYGTGTSIHGDTYYLYRIFLISNGREFLDFCNIYNTPVSF